MSRILVVDDDNAIRHMVVQLLASEHYDVTEAENGARALERVRAERPDGIVLDLMMPVMDGPAFLEACRLEPGCEDIPVVVISATHDILDVASQPHVKACIAKPFDLDALVAVVTRFVPPTNPPA
ncbi:MAG TPA: response regulator [Chloroflexota bacterium]|nr:response regulator [Chloroflexota bacterium]